MLLVSRGFTNAALTAASPVVFSRFGLCSIVLWGLAYLAAARRHRELPWLVAVFALEKLVYVASWIDFMRRHGAGLPRLFAESPLTGAFFAVYGPNDLLFAVFFAAVAARGFRRGAGGQSDASGRAADAGQ